MNIFTPSIAADGVTLQQTGQTVSIKDGGVGLSQLSDAAKDVMLVIPGDSTINTGVVGYYGRGSSAAAEIRARVRLPFAVRWSSMRVGYTTTAAGGATATLRDDATDTALTVTPAPAGAESNETVVTTDVDVAANSDLTVSWVRTSGAGNWTFGGAVLIGRRIA